RRKDTLGEGGEKVLDVFRENPIPLTLVGVGLGWLLLKDSRSGKAMEPGIRAADVASDARWAKALERGSGAADVASGAKEAAQQVGEAASHAASAVSDKIGSV